MLVSCSGLVAFALAAHGGAEAWREPEVTLEDPGGLRLVKS